MLIRLAIAAALLFAVFLVWRNLGLRADWRTTQRKAWDEPLREGTAVILTASATAWWWLVALGILTGIVGSGLFERVQASGMADSIGWWIAFLILAGVTARRGVQLSEQVTVTWGRIASRNLLGPRYDIAVADVIGVTEDDRTALLALRDGRVLALSPWLEGRFWLARELRARLEGRA